MSQRFIKYIPSEKANWLRKHHTMAFVLLQVIAERARRSPNDLDGFEIGDALIGDYEEIGLTRKQYRNALDILVSQNIISIIGAIKSSKNCQKRAIKRAIKGTIVNLLNSEIWDINPEVKGHQMGQRGAIKTKKKGHKQEWVKEREEDIYQPNQSEIHAHDDKVIDLVGLIGSFNFDSKKTTQEVHVNAKEEKAKNLLMFRTNKPGISLLTINRDQFFKKLNEKTFTREEVEEVLEQYSKNPKPINEPIAYFAKVISNKRQKKERELENEREYKHKGKQNRIEERYTGTEIRWQKPS